MLILISGPYTTGAKTEADRKANVQALNRAALAVFRQGHTPIIAANLAVPMAEVADDGAIDVLMTSLTEQLADHCDACLRIGGESERADSEAALFETSGKPVYRAVDQVPEETG